MRRPPRRRPGRPLGDLRQRVAALGPRRLAALLAALALVLAASTVAGAVAGRGGTTISTPFLSYTAPAGWTADGPATPGPLAAPGLTGTVHGPAYDCGGERFVRGYVAAALLPADPAAGSGPADRAERLARWFAAESYPAAGSGTPEVGVSPPRPVRVAGPDGPLDGTVTEATAQTGGRAGCAPARGTVLVLAAPVSGGTALLLVAGDVEGGPAEPAPPDRATLDAVLAGARLSSHAPGPG